MRMSLQKKFILAVLILAILGGLDAAYLTYEHYANAFPPCAVSIWVDCGKVLQSKYAMIGPFPVAFLGLTSYSTLIGLLIVRWFTQKQQTFKEFLWRLVEKYARPKSLTLEKMLFYFQALIAVNGALFSIYFVSLQLFVLHAICLYCMFSAILSFSIFGMTLAEYLKVQKYKL